MNDPSSPATAASADTDTGTVPRRVLVLGATGTIGRAAVRALAAKGHEVVALARPPATEQADDGVTGAASLSGVSVRCATVTDPDSLRRDGFRGEAFDAVVSCMASRTGVPADAWAVDHRAHVDALNAAREAGVSHWVQLSAICLQKPRLPFQHAKLAFEEVLQQAGERPEMAWSIVRPTAYFKSLSGQVERVREGKPYLVFGDGTLTACKPISNADLATYLAGCLDRPDRRNRILPIGGPGPALTPRAQGELLFSRLGREPRFRQVPVSLLSTIAATLGAAGLLVPGLRTKAALARIGKYYATESMLVLDPETGRYDADATPSFGAETLGDHYDRLIRREAGDDRGAHAVF